MKIQQLTDAHVDDRGSIRDLLIGTVCSVTRITSKAGAVRGNHYHKFTTVYVYILTGSFEVASRINGHVVTAQVQAGSLLTFPPKDLHALKALEDSSFLLMADGMRGGSATVAEKLL